MTRVLTHDRSLSLVAGLEWRPPGNGVASRSALREAQRLTDATHYVSVIEEGAQVMYGLHAPMAEDQKPLPRSAHSAAAMFASASREAGHRSAALLLRLPAKHESQAFTSYYLVVIEDGLPLMDLVGDRERVLHALGHDGHRMLWSDDPVEFPGAYPASLEWLSRLPSTGARIVRVPINLVPVLATVCVVATFAAGWFALEQQREVQKQKELAEQARLSDPAPRYLDALQAARARMVSSRQDFLRVAGQVYDLPVFAAGWQLLAAQCVALDGLCLATWRRRGGDYAGLAQALPNHELLLAAGQGSGGADGTVTRQVPNLDEARTRWRVSVARSDLTQVPALRDAIEKGSTVFQQWKLAEMRVDWREPSMWPKVADVGADFAHPQSMRKGDLVVEDVPMPLAFEVLQAAPAWVSWERLDLTVSDPAGEPRRAVNLKITGDFYVAP